MAVSNHERITRAMELLREGLVPFVEREAEARYGQYWITEVTRGWHRDVDWNDDDQPHLDVAALLSILIEQWNEVFRKILGPSERSHVHELKDVRNGWAHQERFSTDDTHRALDTAERLLTAISAPQAAELQRMKTELLRQRYDEERRTEERRSGTVVGGTGALTPWREVIRPHQDVASGRYQQAEFAADLLQVHRGEGSEEYRDPVEFFRRTYLTGSLTRLLVDAVRRLTGQGGDPVVQLQTNFGGGKTHSMLALHHLFGGTPAQSLLGLDPILAEAGGATLPTVRRVVLVGTMMSPGNPVTKPDGTVVRTLWGELAWQLGGAEAYARIAADDEHATNPGDRLRELLNEYGPCLILIDEWVAYARQLHDASDLPGGSFETHFSFAQALTESARLAERCLLVISLPASETRASPHIQTDEVEVGGERGRLALVRLQQVIGRIDSAWRPATAEEGFEIVRRRLFEPLPTEGYAVRDRTARAFGKLYRENSHEFPSATTTQEYEQRLQAAYPIHPEVFDRLYHDWSTLEKFQRTRGVLRLMATVIHQLWENNDRNPLIMPANLAIDDRRVNFELSRYLPDSWKAVVDKDVDGPEALPARLDASDSRLGQYQACRRVARTVYLGTAPVSRAATRGIDRRQVLLGCAVPGETLGLFGDALRRLANEATYLYQDDTRYWYDTQPTVTRLADERAADLAERDELIGEELARRLRADLKERGDFAAVHILPANSGEVSDEPATRLVVLGPETIHIARQDDTPALQAAKEMLETRGNGQRIYRNALVFLLPDQRDWESLARAICEYLAWSSIVAEGDGALNLTPQQVRQARTRQDQADQAVVVRLPECYRWLAYPEQEAPGQSIELTARRLSGTGPLAGRVCADLRRSDALIPLLSPENLRVELDRIPLWPRDGDELGDHVAVRQLADYFAQFVYLYRLRDPEVLVSAVQRGLSNLLWEAETFAYAASWDEAERRYRGLVAGSANAEVAPSGLVVRPAAARAQLDREAAARDEATGTGVVDPSPVDPSPVDPSPIGPVPGGGDEGSVAPPAPRRYHGSVRLDPEQVGLQAARIAEDLVAILAGPMGAQVSITLEIQADLPDNTSVQLTHAILDNGRTLGFDESSGFEME